MTNALVTPQLLQWARERRKLPLEEAAEKLSIKPAKLAQWEQGLGRPTFRQARNLAEKLYIPFGYLFLSDPPNEELPLPDFRTVVEADAIPPSPDFLDVLRDSLRKQQWYKEYQESVNANSLSFVGRFNIENDYRLIASDIRKTLEINQEMRQESTNWENFLSEFIHRSEKAGILVLRNGIVGNNTHRPLSVEEFRGFAISDNLAPLIFINGKDAKTAQIFTLAHELAHLWMGQTGVSNPDYFTRLTNPQNIIERAANQVAAETLLPSEELLDRWNDIRDLKDNIEEIARIYRVSEFVVLRRAFDNEKVQEAEYFNYYQRLIDRHYRTSGASGGNFYRSLLARNSNTLTTTLLIACAEGKVSQKIAAHLLNVKVKSLSSIQREIIFGAFANA